VEEASEAITKKKAQCSTGRRERAPDTTSPTTPVDKFFRSDPATRPQVTLMPYGHTPEARRWLQNTSGFKEVDSSPSTGTPLVVVGMRITKCRCQKYVLFLPVGALIWVLARLLSLFLF
jgi:hypothetical protein